MAKLINPLDSHPYSPEFLISTHSINNEVDCESIIALGLPPELYVKLNIVLVSLMFLVKRMDGIEAIKMHRHTVIY